MIVSFNWLKDYLTLDVPAEELARRLMLAGLNHESTTPIGDDLALDFEVTSNRPDCLGHIGIAREAAVLLAQRLKLPPANPRTVATPAGPWTRVTLECPALCYRYTARVIRGVKVAASPAWLVSRLKTIGIPAVNNVVDVTNYVLMECGQPLHAFDMARLDGREIIVREARPKEQFAAINHRTYELEPGMCVIADRSRAVALGGVMGGAESEVSAATTELLIESAEFDPLSIRTTARRLNLHSDSSYRFERGLDPEGVDWASRRACELILELAGGELGAEVIDVGRQPPLREPIVLRPEQIRRVLGIEIDVDEVRRILKALGGSEKKREAGLIELLPPSWRRDLTREIDLVEEVGRIHGYDAIPEDVRVPMATSARTHRDRVLANVRQTMVAAGMDEAMTLSVVEQSASEAFSPWTGVESLRLSVPILRRADLLRRSLIPSLLLARRTNETLGNPRIELFETARIYLSKTKGCQEPFRPSSGEESPETVPDTFSATFSASEELMLGITSGRDFLAVKGILEAVVASLNPGAMLEVKEFVNELFSPGRGCQLRLDGESFGFLGEVSREGLARFELRGAATVAEIRVELLERIARLVPQEVELSPYPAVERDLNLVVEERVRWSDLAATVRHAAGTDLEQLAYQDTYRDPQRLGAGKKSLLLRLTLRRMQGTLTSAEADQVRDAVVAACQHAHGAQLRT